MEGGAKQFGFWSIIFKIPKTRFFYVLGTFNFWVKGGANNFVLSIFLDRDQIVCCIKMRCK